MDALVGREAPMARLEALAAQCTRGRGRLVALCGPPGMGKTMLLQGFADRAQDEGLAVEWTDTWEWGDAPPYWPLSQLLEAQLARDERLRGSLRATDRVALGDLLPELGEGAEAPNSSAENRRFRLFDAAARLLAQAVRGRPTVWIVDNLHAADGGTLAFLSFLLPRLRRSGLLVLVSRRSVAGPPRDGTADLHDALAGQWEEIDLGPLGPSAVARMVKAMAPDAPANTGAFVHKATGGNPLFVERLVQSLLAESRLEDFAQGAVIVPSSVRGLLMARLKELGPAAQRGLEAAAVAGGLGRPELLASVQGLDLGEVTAQLRELREAGLSLDSPPRFRHALLRDIVYEELDPGRRQELHAATAVFLAAGGDAAPRAGEIAEHLLQAGAEHRADAKPWVMQAAQEAQEKAAWESALRWWTRALELEGGESLALIRSCAEAEILAARPDAARERLKSAIGVARASEDPSELGRVALLLAQTGAYASEDRDNLSLLREAIALEPPDPRLRARLMARLAMELWPAREQEEREDMSLQAIALARSTQDPETIVYALNGRLQATFGPASADQRREVAGEMEGMATRTGVLERILEAQRWCLNVFGERGSIAAFQRSLAVYLETAEGLQTPQTQYAASLRRCFVPFLTGSYEEADALLEASRQAGLDASDPHSETAWSVGKGVLAWLWQREEEVQKTCPLVASHANRLPGLPFYQALVALFEIDFGDAGKGRALAKRILAEDPRELPQNLLTMGHYAVLALLAGRMGPDDFSHEHTERLLRVLRPLAGLNACVGSFFAMGSMAAYLAPLAARLGEHEEAAALWERGLRENEAMGAEPWNRLLIRERARVAAGAHGDGRSAALVPSTPASATLRRLVGLESSGQLWVLRFDGREHHLKAQRGLLHLAKLLASPGSDLAALELAGGVSETEAQGGTGPALDAEAKAAYRARMHSLREDLEEAKAHSDLGRAEKIQEELDFLLRELSQAVGLGGRDREAGSHAERARTAVAKAIARAIKAVAKQEPELGSHLKAQVKTGRVCTYQPDATSILRWQVRLPD